MSERLLRPHREHHDPGHHRQVHVGERVARDRHLLGRRCGAQAPFRDDRHHVEVRPPERGDHGHAEQRADYHRRCRGDARGPHPQRNHRLAERDDDDQRVTLGEVAGLNPPALRAAQGHAAIVGGERRDPADRLGRPVERAGQDEQQRRGHDRLRETEHRHAELAVRARASEQRVRPQVHEPHRQDRDAEQEPIGAERVRHRQRGHDHPRRGREQHHPDEALVAARGVPEPGVRAPDPPRHSQDREALDQARPGGVRGHVARHLGDGQHEDEVEEQLERGHALLAARRWLADRLDEDWDLGLAHLRRRYRRVGSRVTRIRQSRP